MIHGTKWVAEPHSSVGNVAHLNRRSLVRSPARPIFFPKIDDSYCDWIHSSLAAVRCVETTVMLVSSHWLGKNIVRVLVKRTPERHG